MSQKNRSDSFEKSIFKDRWMIPLFLTYKVSQCCIHPKSDPTKAIVVNNGSFCCCSAKNLIQSLASRKKLRDRDKNIEYNEERACAHRELDLE